MKKFSDLGIPMINQEYHDSVMQLLNSVISENISMYVFSAYPTYSSYGSFFSMLLLTVQLKIQK